MNDEAERSHPPVCLKPLWKHNSVPFAAFVKVSLLPPSGGAAKVCLKSIWLSTYSRRPTPHCMSPKFWIAFKLSSGWPSTAKASSPRSPRRSPAATASSRQQKHLRVTPGDEMTLLAAFLALTEPWRSVFAQERTWVRAQRQALGALLVLGRATLSRILWTHGREQKAWSGEYFLHSRAPWDPAGPVCAAAERGAGLLSRAIVGVAVDDTRLRKTGRSIPQAAWHRDPMSPPFHTNLMLGLRFLQASLLLPLHGPDRSRPAPFPSASKKSPP